MFENIINFFKNIGKKDNKDKGSENSKDAAKERLHLVLMQDRANVSADFLELMKQEIIDVIKKYIEIDEKEIDVRLTNKENEDGTNGAPALYANIPILNIKNETRKVDKQKNENKENLKQNEVEEIKKVEKNKPKEIKKEDNENQVKQIIKESEEVIEETIKKTEDQQQEDTEVVKEEEIKSEN